MAFVLVADESGYDGRESPYAVLAGVVVELRRIWPLITAIQQLEVEHFGARLTKGTAEFKAKKLLKAKTFKFAGQKPDFARADRRVLVQEFLHYGELARQGQSHPPPTKGHFTALGQAKLSFVDDVLKLCRDQRVQVVASVLPPDAPRPSANSFLRKDYAYLFESFYNILDEAPLARHGLIVFDELDHTQCHLLVSQMDHYFKETAKGKLRASRILPEPLFVHSELTTLVQVADLVAYIISWGFRLPRMDRAARPELAPFAKHVKALRHRYKRTERWSVSYITDLRPRAQKKEKAEPSLRQTKPPSTP